MRKLGARELGLEKGAHETFKCNENSTKQTEPGLIGLVTVLLTSYSTRWTGNERDCASTAERITLFYLDSGGVGACIIE